MQTITSSETLNTPPATPSVAQRHEGQLKDYELMLASLRRTGLSAVAHLEVLIPIALYSPLYRECEDGVIALWQLRHDHAYQELCKKHNARISHLIVTLKDGGYVYESEDHALKSVTLLLTGNAEWQALKTRIEHAASLLGGQIRSDRSINLVRMCGFYGIAPWNPENAQEHQNTMDALQEKIASHRLRLEDDFEFLDLRRTPTEKDLASIQLLQQTFPGTPLDTQQLFTDQIRAEIIDGVNQFLPEKGSSALTYLANDVLSTATTEQVRATPTVFLEKILQNAAAVRLGNALLTAMDWYGGKTGEATSPYIRTTLIANALQHWISSKSNDNPVFIAGYDWQARSNWGKSYAAIRAEFEASLLTSKRASSEKEAIVIARLFLPRFPIEFRVTDIPVDLAYRGSIVWVNFLNGVNIIKATDPGLLHRLTFEQLVNLPMQRATGATPDELKLIGLARLLPTLDWAVTQGVILQKKPEDYTREDINLALSEQDKHTNDLNEAIQRINEAPPKRLSIAEAEMIKLFGKDAFLSDGRKLARFDELGSIGFRDTPMLRGKEFNYYSFVDVLASGKFDDQKRWLVTQGDGTSISERWIRIDESRTIKTGGAWRVPGSVFGNSPLGPYAKLPDVEALFDKDFKSHLERITAAYETLIRSLLASLPFSERQALEYGEVTIYSLRKSAPYTLAQEETPASILALRARNGLILQTTYNEKTLFHELLPRAGMIRRPDKFFAELIGGRVVPKGRHLDGNDVHMWGEKHLPFDWDAHSTGSVPKNNARCSAIIEQLGPVLSAISDHVDNAQRVPRTLTSSRSVKISNHIATHLLFAAPDDLRSIAHGQTQFEREEASRKKIFKIAKIFVPFWNSIEDVTSGDRSRIRMGAIGLVFDVLSFALPLGKFAAGSARLVTVSGRLIMRTTHQSLASLTKNLVISTLQTLNPVDAVYSLLKGLGHILKGLGTTFKYAKQAGNVRYYEYVRSLPQLSDVGRWKPFVVGDQLASVKGIDDVPVRNLSTTDASDWRLIDPLSSKPYGPSIPARSGELSFGRSHFSNLEKSNPHVIVEVPESTRVREVFEIDGRTTVFLDDVPYRLQGDTLRRVDLIDDSARLKLIPCRARRAPGGSACLVSYVNGEPFLLTPPVGSLDETKGYAPWFGDRISSPGTRVGHEQGFLALDGAVYQVSGDTLTLFKGDLTALGFSKPWLVPGKSIPATLEFRKGIYARLNVESIYEGATDSHRVGAVLVPSLDGIKTYVFTRLNTDKYYFTTVPTGQSLTETLTLERLLKPQLAEGTPGAELLRVYTGSLGANNVARIYGVEAIERAIETMERIAIRIGTIATPPNNMKWIKVDTSPAEALMFDHSTRMIVTQLADGATSWTRSKLAPEAFRQRTVEIFDTLFLEKAIDLNNVDSALRIDRTMEKLHRLIPRHQRTKTPRNIAYAEVLRADGKREVYVSVSGAQGATGHLPLFKQNLGADQIKVGETTYFNIDMNVEFPRSSLLMDDQGKLLAVPPTIDDIGTYHPALTSRPTSLDSESKLISVIREKYPDPQSISSVNVATTMPPCDSCTVVMKEFGHDGGANALNVLWH